MSGWRRLLKVSVSILAAGLFGVGLGGSSARGAEALTQTQVSAGSIKVGIVDLRRAFQESKSVEVAKEELIHERDEKLQVLKVRQREVTQFLESIRSQRELLSEAVRRKKEEELRTKRRSLERLKSDSEQELNRQFLAINQLFIADAQREIKGLGRDSGYTLILDVNNDFVLYGSETVDLTDQLIERLNNQNWSQR
jgi:Skp family chaperone for outer membrane proteins